MLQIETVAETRRPTKLYVREIMRWKLSQEFELS